MKKHNFLWFDLETTGLDPHEGRVLEFAAVLCEDAEDDDLAIVQQYAGVVHYSIDELMTVPRAKAVLAMHDANGLWKDVMDSTTTIEDVDNFLAGLASELTGGRKRAVTLAGSSVHFDLAWARVRLPTFAEYLSHRVFDVTTLRRAVEAWLPGEIDWPKRTEHRALNDIQASIEEARLAKRAMIGGKA